MNVFPVDSVISEIGTDGLPVYDRPYSAKDLREVYETFFSNGVFMEDPNSLFVSTATGMNVTVNPGKCHINGAVGYESTIRTLAIPASDPALDRISTVVARLNLNVDSRTCDLYVINGTADRHPRAPELTRNSTIWEIGLADIFVVAGSGAISQQRITDTRLNTARCGAVAPFEELDTTRIYDQLQSQVDENIQTIQNAIDGTTASILDSKIDDSVATINSTFLPKSGGQMTGALSFKDEAALPQKDNAATGLVLTLDDFGAGGQLGWARTFANFKQVKIIAARNGQDIDIGHVEENWVCISYDSKTRLAFITVYISVKWTVNKNLTKNFPIFPESDMPARFIPSPASVLMSGQIYRSDWENSTTDQYVVPIHPLFSTSGAIRTVESFERVSWGGAERPVWLAIEATVLYKMHG